MNIFIEINDPEIHHAFLTLPQNVPLFEFIIFYLKTCNTKKSNKLHVHVNEHCFENWNRVGTLVYIHLVFDSVFRQIYETHGTMSRTTALILIMFCIFYANECVSSYKKSRNKQNITSRNGLTVSVGKYTTMPMPGELDDHGAMSVSEGIQGIQFHRGYIPLILAVVAMVGVVICVFCCGGSRHDRKKDSKV